MPTFLLHYIHTVAFDVQLSWVYTVTMSTSNDTALKITHLTKKYDEEHGIHDISLTVKKGEVFGFLGPNGAGKSTTINTILDLLRPDSGTIEILGLDHKSAGKQARRHIGYVSGDMETDPTLTGKQYLNFVSHIYSGVDQKSIDTLTKRLKVDLDTKIKHLSRGNKQKIGLVTALMHNPDVLILDEPTSGLDPLIQTEFNAIINEFKAQGKTTFMSSHVLSEVQETCDRVGFIRDGKLVHVSSLKELLANTPRMIEVRFKNKNSHKQIPQLEHSTHIKQVDGLLSFTYAGDINRLVRLFATHPVESLKITEPDLEDLFMKYYTEGKSNA